MFDSIMTYLSIIGIYLGIPAAGTALFWGIMEYYDRQIIRESRVRCSDCGTSDTNVLSIVGETITCADCNRDRVFA